MDNEIEIQVVEEPNYLSLLMRRIVLAKQCFRGEGEGRRERDRRGGGWEDVEEVCGVDTDSGSFRVSERVIFPSFDVGHLCVCFPVIGPSRERRFPEREKEKRAARERQTLQEKERERAKKQQKTTTTMIPTRERETERKRREFLLLSM